MDGLKRTITGSLQAQLSFWLSVVIIATSVGGGYFSFRGTFHEANEFQDDQLRQIAGLMQQQEPHTGLLITQSIEQSEDPESQVIVQVLAPDVNQVRLLDEDVSLPSSLPEIVQTVPGNRYMWRVFLRHLPDGARLVVSQRTDVRDEIANSSAWRTVYPLALLMPLLLLLINVLVRTMLKPVKTLSQDLDRRRDSDLSPLDDRHVPSEIRPFTASINALLLRVKRSVDMQKRFVADAAHELRSPLTALSLQADNIRKIELSPVAQERMMELRGGLQRMRSLLEQLLVMARSQESVAHPDTTISMEDVFKQVLEDLIPSAEAKNLDVEVDTERSAVFSGQLFDALMLIKNLADNAIRYTPAGGRLILRARRENYFLIVTVEDSGPGIPEEEMERIFDPFYRILGSGESGSGLGLAIVKAIVERNGATINFSNCIDDSGARCGLCATVRFPH
ncbi:ATP-binding protein [Herbaspirillum sp. WKF16]|uniref:sensor histidine kinase n=1 Tax=Herbaspirillum sp. WKF16 TaxID=3028312 RepID=UPI0023A9480F|nr:ATP-binding protein [Herbaspirillum sp. WKF16]WDZ95812.1 ATP-binding protein [Herbaspirillum sp. WKF16]